MASWHRKIVGRRLWLCGLLRKSCFVTLDPYANKHNERSVDSYLSVYAPEIRQQTTRINSKYTNAPIKRTANAPHDQHNNFKVHISVHALQLCHQNIHFSAHNSVMHYRYAIGPLYIKSLGSTQCHPWCA